MLIIKTDLKISVKHLKRGKMRHKLILLMLTMSIILSGCVEANDEKIGVTIPEKTVKINYFEKNRTASQLHPALELLARHGLICYGPIPKYHLQDCFFVALAQHQHKRRNSATYLEGGALSVSNRKTRD